MPNKFRNAVDFLIEDLEGVEYTNHSSDPGGATKYGISLRFFKSNVNENATAEDINNLSREDAEQLYMTYFWEKYKIYDVDSARLATIILSTFVHIGPHWATKFLQRSVNAFGTVIPLVEDGVFGRKTRYSVNLIDPEQLIFVYAAYVLAYLIVLTCDGRSLRYARTGFINRVIKWRTA